MRNEEEMIVVMEKLLNIADTYLECYCENFDEYVLKNEEIEHIDNQEEKERARNLKETDDFLRKVELYIKEYKEEHVKQEEFEEIC